MGGRRSNICIQRLWLRSRFFEEVGLGEGLTEGQAGPMGWWGWGLNSRKILEFNFLEILFRLGFSQSH